MRHEPSGRWQLGLGLSLTTALLWGFLPIALTLLLQRIDPLSLMGVRFLVAGVFTGLMLAQGRHLGIFRTLPRTVWALLIIATLGLASNYYFFQMGLHLTTPGTAQILIQLSPLVLLISSVAIFKESMTRWQWVGVGGVFVGLLLFFAPKLGGAAMSEDYVKGIVCVLIAGAAWVFYALAQKQALQAVRSQAIMFFVYLASAVLSFPFADFGKLQALDGLGVGLLIFASANTIVAYGAFAESLAHWPASRVSAVLALTPVLTMMTNHGAHELWPDVVPEEILPGVSYAGAALVVAGSMLASLAGKRHARPAKSGI